MIPPDYESQSQELVVHAAASSETKEPRKFFPTERRTILLLFALAAVFVIIVVITVAVLLTKPKQTSSSNGTGSYVIWCTGKCNGISAPTNPGTVLMGGSTDVDEAFIWQIRRAGGGDFVVLRASGSDGYNDYIYNLSVAIGKPLNSVVSVLFNSKEASEEPAVLNYIRGAEAVFFAGGDQSLYMKYWVGTSVQRILQSKVGNVTIGGTSAGLAILGGWIYSADNNGGWTNSPEALADPYNANITLPPKLLSIPWLGSYITDSHFQQRDRMGRMLTFVARILTDNTAIMAIQGIGVNEETALLLNHTTGDAQLVGKGFAYICKGSKKPEICASQKPLTFKTISCLRLDAFARDTYRFSTMQSALKSSYFDNPVVIGNFSSYVHRYG